MRLTSGPLRGLLTNTCLQCFRWSRNPERLHFGQSALPASRSTRLSLRFSRRTFALCYSCTKPLLNRPAEPSASPSPAANASMILGETDRTTTSYCVLCDTPFANWIAHAELPSHAARASIGQAFVKPERSASMLAQLQQHIGLDFSVVEEATEQKVRRRQRRLRSSLQYLKTETVLQRCVPQPVESEGRSSAAGSGQTFLVQDGMRICAVVGEGFAVEELTDRVARLAPKSSGSAVKHMVEYLCSPRQWGRLFDQLQLQSILCPPAAIVSTENSKDGSQQPPSPSASTSKDSPIPPRRSVRFTQDQKAMLVLSLLGELRLFTARDRSHKVDSKSVTDHLVLHVLASHCAENLLSELLHETLERVVEETTPVWREYQVQEEQMRMRAYQSRPTPLSPTPAVKPEVQPTEATDLSRRNQQLRDFFTPLAPLAPQPPGVQEDLEAETEDVCGAAAPNSLSPETVKGKGKKDESRSPTNSKASGTAMSPSRNMATPRGHWQEVYRQLLYERPIVPAETPAAVYAGFYPRLQRT